MTETIETKICPWSNEMKNQCNSLKTDSEKEKFIEKYKDSQYENCPGCPGRNIDCKVYQKLVKFL